MSNVNKTSITAPAVGSNALFGRPALIKALMRADQAEELDEGDRFEPEEELIILANEVRLMREAICEHLKDCGPRSHHRGCACGGFNRVGESPCGTGEKMMRDIVQPNDPAQAAREQP